jgi:hypothetical protein
MFQFVLGHICLSAGIKAPGVAERLVEVQGRGIFGNRPSSMTCRADRMSHDTKSTTSLGQVRVSSFNAGTINFSMMA